MIIAILQGIIVSQIELKQYENNERASCNFKIKCLNSIQRNITCDVIAYNSLATRIYSNYQKDDIVTMMATFDIDNKFLIFSIEPSNISIIAHRKLLHSDNYVSAEREYTTEDIKEFLKIK